MKPLACLIAACLAQPAAALELTLREFYDLNRPASLDYDPTFCGLWIANEGPEAILVTLQGDELRRVTSDLRRIKAIGVEDDGLLVSDGFGSFQRLTRDGAPKAAPFRASDAFSDIEGLVIDDDGLIVTVEDDPERLTWFTPDGQVTRRIDTMTLDPPLSEPQGIARDPRTGNLLIVDDWEGTNSLYEFTEDGGFLARVPLIAYGRDPEGIAIRPRSGELFIAFDQGARIAAFDYVPTPVAGGQPLPEGGDCLLF